ncbi:hypothetical protein M407DRAFT_22275 [Tulasnella calospora MUT 4182]|uniref:Uncharacterized protein n=1 Tax=Tulasnella calospora MUT 4182 TaxID=1051891 RepID=A0A0C3QNB5_9AGAM|nr:hypothetical protein M407DRAFT_22275 [Tulasnella calospora MUT 4182]
MPLDEPEKRLIFDGGDNSTSEFNRFIQDLQRSLSDPGSEHMIDLVPTRLYGKALRAYEALPLECQQTWEDLEFAMASCFPSLEACRELAGLVLTPAAAPPPMSSAFTLTAGGASLEDSKFPLLFSRLIGHRPLVSLLRRKDKPRAQPIPQIVVYSLFIERIDDFEPCDMDNPKIVTRLIEVLLSDARAVAKTAKQPILTIPAKDAKR